MLKVTAADFNDDTIFTEMRIYRSDLPFTSTTLPENPKVVLTKETTYDEGELPTNVRFYYMVETVTTKGSRFSKLHSLILWEDNGYSVTGKVCDHLIAGDADLGYFGTCPLDGLPDIYTLFDNYPDIKAAATFASRPYDYSKYVNNGKVFFFPHVRQVNNVSFLDLYQMGLAFESDAQFEAISPNLKNIILNGKPPVPQGKIVNALGYKYKVRIPKSSDIEGAGRAMFTGWKTGVPGYLWANTVLPWSNWSDYAWLSDVSGFNYIYLLNWASGYTDSGSTSKLDEKRPVCFIFEYVGKVDP